MCMGTFSACELECIYSDGNPALMPSYGRNRMYARYRCAPMYRCAHAICTWTQPLKSFCMPFICNACTERGDKRRNRIIIELCHYFLSELHETLHVSSFECQRHFYKFSCILEASEARYRPALKPQKQLNQMRKQVSHGSTATPARMSGWINTKQIHNIFKWAPLAKQITSFCTHRWCHLEYAKICGQSVIVKMLLSHQFWQRVKTAERHIFPSAYIAIHPTKLHGCLTYG